MSKIICVFRSIICEVKFAAAQIPDFQRGKQVSSDFVLLQTNSMADHTVKRHQITITQMHYWLLANYGHTIRSLMLAIGDVAGCCKSQMPASFLRNCC